MKLTDITPESIRKVSGKELLSLHRRCHQLYALAILRKGKPEFIMFIVKVHAIIEAEMKARGFKHKTPLSARYTLENFLYYVKERI